MRFDILYVSRQQAEEWLTLNTDNRAISASTVDFYTESMKNGEWEVTHEAIALTATRLIDGQHRLLALLKSGLEGLTMSVCFDANPLTYDVINGGKPRSHGDHLGVMDRNVMTPLNYIGRLVLGGKFSSRSLRPVVSRFIGEIRELNAVYPQHKKTFGAAPIKVGAIAAILNGEPKKYVHNTYCNLANVNIAELPKVGLSFVKQVALEGGSRRIQSGQREQLLVRSFVVFQEANATLERLVVQNHSPKYNEIRALFRGALNM